jgi:hypothetical protein
MRFDFLLNDVRPGHSGLETAAAELVNGRVELVEITRNDGTSDQIELSRSEEITLLALVHEWEKRRSLA